jgi:tetratricopeptide (TPR) repeat protein
MSKNEMNEMEDQNNDAVVQASEVDPTVKKLKTIGYIVVGAVICASALYFYNGMNAAKNEEAMTALSRISSYYDSGDTKKALEGDPARNIRGGQVIGLKAIVEEYGGTDAGKIAGLQAGSVLLEEGKFQEAVEYFELAVKSADPYVSAGGKAGLAACKEYDKQYEAAAALYLEASGDKNSSLYEKYIFFAAINYEKMSLNGGSTGSKEKAIEIYKNIVLKNSGSEFINEAKMGLTRLNWHDN